jgi:hypothetical protein
MAQNFFISCIVRVIGGKHYMIEKIPLLNSPKTSVKVLGAILYIFVGLIILGAIAGPQKPQAGEKPALNDSGNSYINTSSAGQTGLIKYATSEGTVIVDLPVGFYLTHTFGSVTDHMWSIDARKNGTGMKYQALTITWGHPGSFKKKIEDTLAYQSEINNPLGGRYLKTFSGHDAWIMDWKGYEPGYPNSSNLEDMGGRHLAYVDYTVGGSEFMQIRQVPGTEDSLPQEGMPSKEFEDFVKSINIKR